MARVEERNREVDAGGGEAFERFRAVAGGNEFAENHFVFADAGFVEDENFLEDDFVAVHAGDFGDVDDFAGAVGEAADLDDEIDGGSDLRADYVIGISRPPIVTMVSRRLMAS